MSRLVLLGPPGAGKGTQARLLEAQFGALHIATGDLLRTHLSEHTPLGSEAESFMDRGLLVPDALIVRMVEAEIGSATSFILDGFPRTIAQALFLDTMLLAKQTPLDAVFFFACDRKELISRLTGRWTNPRTGRSYHTMYDAPRVHGVDDDDGGALIQRPDDTPAVVERRLQTYDSETLPLVEFYEKRSLLVRIDALRPIDEVTGEITAVLSTRRKTGVR